MNVTEVTKPHSFRGASSPSRSFGVTAYINPEPVHVYLVALFNPIHVSTSIVSISEDILFVEKVTYMSNMECVEFITLEPCTYHCMCETFGLYNSGYIRQGLTGRRESASYRPVV